MIVVVMGPAGAGKTTVGRALAAALACLFVDADDFHSPHNRARLARGEALSDDERAPWLQQIADVIASAVARHETAVIACSALKRAYRDALMPRDAAQAVHFVYLQVSASELQRRLVARVDHFAPAALLESQLATLEDPTSEARTITVDGEQPVDVIVADIRAQIRR